MTAEGERTSDLIHDLVADAYGEEIADTTTQRIKSMLIEEHVRRGHRVLDVGCASGLHFRAAHVASVVGIDLNARMAAIARRSAPNAGVVQGSAVRLPFRDAMFDVTWSYSTLLLVPGLDRAVAELARVTTPGGIVIVDLAGRYNLSQLFFRFWYRRHGHRTLNSMSMRSANRLLRAHGLIPEQWHAAAFTDQWRYVPMLRRSSRLERWFHDGVHPDLDHRISNRRSVRRLAARWYVVARRSSADRRDGPARCHGEDVDDHERCARGR